MKPLHLLGLGLLAAILCATPAAFAADINQKLDTIVLDDIDFENMPFKEAASLIRENSARRDPQGQGINVAIKHNHAGDDRDKAPITLKMTQPTLRAALDEIGRRGNFKVNVQPYAVLFLPIDYSSAP